MKHLKTRNQLNEASENLNISDVIVSVCSCKNPQPVRDTFIRILFCNNCGYDIKTER